jgi:phospholipid/cholesterol/gamma-HCH transport system ATP-binding protein
MSELMIELNNIFNAYGEHTVHEDLSFSLRRGEIVAIIGPSGCGKTTLLNTLLMLHQPTSGHIRLFGENIDEQSHADLLTMRSRMGVLFQSGALFSSMTVLENIIYPITAFTELKKEVVVQLARVKLALVGLSQQDGELYPAELSGGMVKRVAMARALALDPELIILDEPTAGLDPDSASDLDHLIIELRQYLDLSGILITHDLETLLTVPDRVCFMGEGKIIADAPLLELCGHEHPLIQQYFSSERAKRLLRKIA